MRYNVICRQLQLCIDLSFLTSHVSNERSVNLTEFLEFCLLDFDIWCDSFAITCQLTKYAWMCFNSQHSLEFLRAAMCAQSLVVCVSLEEENLVGCLWSCHRAICQNTFFLTLDVLGIFPGNVSWQH